MSDESLEIPFYVLSRQAQNPESHLPPAIRDHMQRIARHPGTESLPVLRSIAGRLARYWDGIVHQPGTRLPRVRQLHRAGDAAATKRTLC
jgi:hypothetical protein